MLDKIFMCGIYATRKLLLSNIYKNTSKIGAFSPRIYGKYFLCRVNYFWQDCKCNNINTYISYKNLVRKLHYNVLYKNI